MSKPLITEVQRQRLADAQRRREEDQARLQTRVVESFTDWLWSLVRPVALSAFNAVADWLLKVFTRRDRDRRGE